MNTEVVFIIIVVFLVADFIVERILEWVNMRAMAPVLPENLKGIYDEKEYARFQNYKRETNRFDLISSTFEPNNILYLSDYQIIHSILIVI